MKRLLPIFILILLCVMLTACSINVSTSDTVNVNAVINDTQIGVPVVVHEKQNMRRNRI